MTSRARPIYPTTIVGRPPQEDDWLGKATERIFLPVTKLMLPEIVDINMPQMSGLAVTRVLKRRHPQTGVIILTMHEDDEQLFNAIRVGAAAYCTKDVDPSHIVGVIRRVARGEYPLGRVPKLELARRLFGSTSPIGETVRIGGRPFRVVGVWQQPDNVFQPPGFTIGATVPYQVAKHSFQYSDTNDLFLVVLGRHGIPVSQAQDHATAALRRERGLRPGMPNTFDFITQDQILETMNSLTAMFFLVMTAISSVALLVGGIGVMAIMMVSVTDRTHEIGLRMACGASRREILWQFLVEAATLTLLGGLIGILLGLTSGQVVKQVLDMQSAVPLWSAVLATLVSIAIGLGFGLLPANRAARMDPVEALRHE